MIGLNQLRWTGYVVYMHDSRLPKRLFCGELKVGKRPQHKPKKRFDFAQGKNQSFRNGSEQLGGAISQMSSL